MILARFVGSISGARLSPIIGGPASSGAPLAPTVTTSTSSEAVGSVAVSGTFTGATTSRYFQHGASSGALNSTLNITNDATSGTLTGLSDSETKFFRAVGQNDNYVRTITGTINPNFFSTQLSLIWGTSPTLDGATTVNLGTFTGNTATSFSASRSSVAGTTYYYKIVATNVFTTVESSIISYIESPAIGLGTTRSQTTAATQPTPSIVWEASETTRIVDWRLYLTSAADTTYRWEYSSNRSSWTDGGAMSAYGTQHWTPYLNPGTVDYATTYTYYRAKATDGYGRVKYSNVRGVAPINLKWGAIRSGVQVPGAYDTGVPSGSFVMDAIGREVEDAVKIQSFLGSFSRYRVTSTRWILDKNGTTGFATSLNRRFRLYFRNGWSSERTGDFDGANRVQYDNFGDYPDNSLSRSNDGYWTKETLQYGGGDMPSSGGVYPGGASNLWGSSTANTTSVEVYVFIEEQGLRTTTTNSESLYYAGAT
jgi:hypothetical protein